MPILSKKSTKMLQQKLGDKGKAGENPVSNPAANGCLWGYFSSAEILFPLFCDIKTARHWARALLA
ncbi:hypothetical protein [Sinorhizobium sp. NFACC03]|uniref:hypothetical protein n=1 Tax=Sinorhizobium sp. NFACC03 TaxID=1566295 RepID=UPI00115F904B|nr:hypothetical protein [Sinorhizobium sp. NFACC03]